MTYRPGHTCFKPCAGCAYELGVQDAKKKPKDYAKYVWQVIGSNNPCDIRRYAFSHKEAVDQLAHAKARGRKYKDIIQGEWVLFKLVRVNREKTKD